jgi:DNA-binding IscR family transcriptional regulator
MQTIAEGLHLGKCRCLYLCAAVTRLTSLAKLSKAGLVETATGKGGACWLARPARDISLVEIYRAVDAPKVFAIHQYPVEKRCPVSCNIKSALNRVLDETQKALEQRLSRISLAQVISDLRNKRIFLG